MAKPVARPSSEAKPEAPAAEKKKGRPGPRAYRGDSEFWDLKDRYLEWMAATGYAPTSMKGAHSDLSWFFRHLEKKAVDRVADVTPEVLEGYSLALREPGKTGLAPSPRSVSRRLISLQQFFKWLAKEAVILYDPTEDLAMPKLPTELPKEVLTIEEMNRMLDSCDLGSPVGYRDRALLEILYGSGVRTSELCRLKVENLDYRHQCIHVIKGKGGKDRVIPVPAVCLGYARQYVDKVRPRFAKNLKTDDGTLFLNYTGRVLTRNHLCHIFKEMRRRAGITKHVTPLSIRHTMATLMLENGMDSRYLQEDLGHDRLATTQQYLKCSLSGMKKFFNAAHPKERRERRR